MSRKPRREKANNERGFSYAGTFVKLDPEKLFLNPGRLTSAICGDS